MTVQSIKPKDSATPPETSGLVLLLALLAILATIAWIAV